MQNEISEQDLQVVKIYLSTAKCLQEDSFNQDNVRINIINRIESMQKYMHGVLKGYNSNPYYNKYINNFNQTDNFEQAKNIIKQLNRVNKELSSPSLSDTRSH